MRPWHAGRLQLSPELFVINLGVTAGNTHISFAVVWSTHGLLLMKLETFE